MPESCSGNRQHVLDRFFDKVRLDPDTGCWLWTASTREGYGQFADGINKGMVKAHRWLWQQLGHGALTQDVILHHMCEVRTCVNPSHLTTTNKSDHAKLHGNFKNPELQRELAKRRWS